MSRWTRNRRRAERLAFLFVMYDSETVKELYEDEMRFKSKVVLVAGGTGGLGRAVSLAFLRERANVVVTYRRAEEFQALEGTAGVGGLRLAGHQVDVTDEAAARKLVDEIVAEHGRLDAMVNTVGGYAGGVKLWDLETKTLDQMLSLNLRAGYALARAAIGPMLKQKAGAIV